MYSFQTGAGRRKAQQTVRILSVVVFVLVDRAGGVTVSYPHLPASAAQLTTRLWRAPPTRRTRRNPPSIA